MSTKTETGPNPEVELARRVANGLMERALETPKADWHIRYRFVNRAAGVIAGWACGCDDAQAGAQRILDLIGAIFAPNGPRDVASRVTLRKEAPWRAERSLLFDGLIERTAAVLVELGL